MTGGVTHGGRDARDGPDFLDPTALARGEAYRLLTGLVVPRPIAWVSTVAPDGTRNLAPHSYFNILSSDPPIIHVTSAGEKDTLRNVRATREFVVNIVSEDLVDAMNLTSANFPADEDEFSWAGLEAAASGAVAPPRVAAARAALECRLRGIVSMGDGNMMLGDVVGMWVDPALRGRGGIDPLALAAVGRLGGNAYTRTRDVFRRDRPTWEQLRKQ